MQLVEIPTKDEINDNIVAFWRPKAPLAAKGEYTYTYRLHWGPDAPKPHVAGAIFPTPASAREATDATIFVIDVIGEQLKTVDPTAPRGVVTADKAKVRNVVTQPNPETGGWRLELRTARSEKTRRAARIAHAGRRSRIGSLGLSMDALSETPRGLRAGDDLR